MATRSTIGIKRTDRTVTKIYCHWDGYLEHNGAILQKYYNTADKVEELLKLGNLSCLGPKPIPDDTWESRDFERCKPYTLRGEPWEQAGENQMEEYNYLFDAREAVWIVSHETYNRPGETAKSLGISDPIYDCYETAYLIDMIAKIPDKSWEGMKPASENDWGISFEDCMNAAREARKSVNERKAAQYEEYYRAYCD